MRSTLRTAATCVAAVAALLPAGCTASRRADLSTPEGRIREFERRVAKSPLHYHAYVGLGQAYLDQARQTHDPASLRNAREALQRSLDIQPNFQAFVVMAAVCNFSHRFDEALIWGQKAMAASPMDMSALAQLIESNLGLGRENEAEQLASSPNLPPDDFYLLVSQGRIAAAKDQVDHARRAFERAAAAADRQGAADFAVWARVMAAGVLIDAGRTQEARPLLEQAATMQPAGFMLRLHRVELAQAEHRPADALALCRELLREHDDPSLHARAYGLAKALRYKSAGDRHFAAAEAGFRRVLDAGEVYTLGSLATLYAKAGVRLPEALELAERNLLFKRDAQARATVEELRGLIAPQAGG